jgi:hypothetical protein
MMVPIDNELDPEEPDDELVPLSVLLDVEVAVALVRNPVVVAFGRPFVSVAKAGTLTGSPAT